MGGVLEQAASVETSITPMNTVTSLWERRRIFDMEDLGSW